MMKKVIFLSCCLMLAFSLVACGNEQKIKGDTTIQIAETVYYNSQKAIPVEPDQSSIVDVVQSEGSASENDKIEAYAFLNKGDSDEMLVGLIDGEWYEFLPKQVTAEDNS